MADTSSSRPFEYLEGQPGTVYFKLYQQPSTALAIFRRMLPDLGSFLSEGRAKKKGSEVADLKLPLQQNASSWRFSISKSLFRRLIWRRGSSKLARSEHGFHASSSVGYD